MSTINISLNVVLPKLPDNHDRVHSRLLCGKVGLEIVQCFRKEKIVYKWLLKLIHHTPHRHWVGRGTGTPKDKDEVNRQEVCECDG